MDLAKIKKITESMLKKNEYKYKNIKIETIFQLIFFDRNSHNIDYKKKAKEDHTELVKTKDELNETKNELSKTKNELNEAKNEINEKESRLTAANNELDKAKNEINEKESRLTEANNKLEEKIEIIKRLNEIIKNAKLDEKIKLELDKVFKGEK
jgi:chromosome segregation ATPase